MSSMSRRAALLATLAGVLLAGCGSQDAPPMPAACLDEPTVISAALKSAPRPVRLGDEVALSRCVSLARDADLQALGVTLTRVADDLRARAGSDPMAALALGYLVGAVRRGASLTPGVGSQLARRVEQASLPAIEAGRSQAQLLRGRRSGEAGG